MVDSDSDEGGGDYAEVIAATPVDIKEYSNSSAFVFDMPGLETGSIRNQVKANNVLFTGSKRRRVEGVGAKHLRMWKFALPDSANTDKITAVLRDGVLTVTVEKLPKTIEKVRGMG